MKLPRILMEEICKFPCMGTKKDRDECMKISWAKSFPLKNAFFLHATILFCSCTQYANVTYGQLFLFSQSGGNSPYTSLINERWLLMDGITGKDNFHRGTCAHKIPIGILLVTGREEVKRRLNLLTHSCFKPIKQTWVSSSLVQHGRTRKFEQGPESLGLETQTERRGKSSVRTLLHFVIHLDLSVMR